jgi:hypothetical protein
MKLTSKVIEHMYIMLCNIEPFSRWKLPCPEEIKFTVTDDESSYGTYVYNDETEMHEITISKAKNGWFETTLRTLCHEIIHMTRGKTSNYDKHDAYFKRKAKLIADELGFDALEL